MPSVIADFHLAAFDAFAMLGCHYCFRWRHADFIRHTMVWLFYYASCRFHFILPPSFQYFTADCHAAYFVIIDYASLPLGLGHCRFGSLRHYFNVIFFIDYR